MKLTPSDHRKMLASLKRRYPKSRYPTLVSVGLGTALVGGRPDPNPQRELAVCFYVTEKKLPRNKRQRFPGCVPFRLQRGGRWQLVSLRTDVISLEKVSTTGAHIGTIREPGLPDQCAAGVLVRWIEGGDSRFGGMTVGHAVRTPAAPPSQRAVKLSLGASGAVQIGTVRARIPTANEIDLAVFEFTNQLLFSDAAEKPIPLFRHITGDTLAAGPALVSHGSVGFPNRHPGKSFRPKSLGDSVVFTTAGYVPVLTFDHHGGELVVQHLVRAESHQDGAFGPESSGSAWTRTMTDAAGNATERLIAIQVGADAGNGYRTGYGQLLTKVAVASEDVIGDAMEVLREQIGGSKITIAGFC